MSCSLEPPTLKFHSGEPGTRVFRCSSVMLLLASPWNLAPTEYAAAVSNAYTT